MLGIIGANQKLLSYDQIENIIQDDVRNACIIFLLVHEIGHSLMRILLNNPMAAALKLVTIPNNSMGVEPNLESGFAICHNFLIFFLLKNYFKIHFIFPL